MSTKKDCRPGMSKAFTTPSSAASTKICQTVHLVGQGERREHERQQHGRDLRRDDYVLRLTVRHDAAERRKEEYGNLAGEADGPQQQARTGQAVDEPRLGHGLHPGSGEGNELAAEK